MKLHCSLIAATAALALAAKTVLAQNAPTMIPRTQMPPIPWKQSVTSTATSGVVAGTTISSTLEIKPPSSSTAIVANGVFITDYPALAAAITGGGHVIGALGWVTDYNTTQTLPLAIGVEGKIETALYSRAPENGF